MMTRSELTPTLETLYYWNNQGAINCERHAPYGGSDTWNNQQWQQITVAELAEAHAAGFAIKCEICECRKAARS